MYSVRRLDTFPLESPVQGSFCFVECFVLRHTVLYKLRRTGDSTIPTPRRTTGSHTSAPGRESSRFGGAEGDDHRLSSQVILRYLGRTWGLSRRPQHSDQSLHRCRGRVCRPPFLARPPPPKFTDKTLSHTRHGPSHPRSGRLDPRRGQVEDR